MELQKFFPEAGSTGRSKRDRKDTDATDKAEKAAQRKQLAQLVKKAEEVKTLYMKVTGTQASLDQSINSDPAYTWGRSGAILGTFKQCKMDSSSFNNMYLGTDLAPLKKKYGDEISKHLTAFLNTREPIEALAREQAKFNRMHQVQQEP